MYVLLFTCKDGKYVNLIIGGNAPRLTKIITDEVEHYEKFKKGEIEIESVGIPIMKLIFTYVWLLMFFENKIKIDCNRSQMSMDTVTIEEQRKCVEKEEYEKQKMKKEKKIRGGRFLCFNYSIIEFALGGLVKNKFPKK